MNRNPKNKNMLCWPRVDQGRGVLLFFCAGSLVCNSFKVISYLNECHVMNDTPMLLVRSRAGGGGGGRGSRGVQICDSVWYIIIAYIPLYSVNEIH